MRNCAAWPAAALFAFMITVTVSVPTDNFAVADEPVSVFDIDKNVVFALIACVNVADAKVGVVLVPMHAPTPAEVIDAINGVVLEQLAPVITRTTFPSLSSVIPPVSAFQSGDAPAPWPISNEPAVGVAVGVGR